jgi:hypothetical protein
VSVNAGDVVQFDVTGTFDWDGVVNGNEVTQDLTAYCNWTAVADPPETAFAFDTGAGSLDTTGAGSGAEINATCQFPRTDDITLYDNLPRASNFVTVNIN